jgi:RNA polymerase sigma-70 factor (ECF subfamily)
VTIETEPLDDSGLPDRSLWEAAATGDAEAFAALYLRHVDAIYGYCFRRTASWSAAQDLTSVVFLEAWRRRAEVRIDDGSTVRGWLFGVAGNVLRTRARSLRRHRAALDQLAARTPTAETRDLADEVAARLDDEARMARVLAALERLPRTDQELLALTAWSGLSQPEIAATLGLPLGTVKSRLSRARERLRGLSSEPVLSRNPLPVKETQP